MPRFHTVIDALTGQATQVQFTAAEELAADTPVDYGPIDQAALNQALAAEGSVVRALALVLLQEINILRGKVIPALPAYTQAQLVAALKAKMR